MSEDEKQAERQIVESVLAVLLDGEKIGLTETLLVADVSDARKLLHQASILLAELAGMLPMAYQVTIVADALHRVSCEKTANEVNANPEEPKTWNSELPFH